jgi:hypothetical protein
LEKILLPAPTLYWDDYRIYKPISSNIALLTL